VMVGAGCADDLFVYIYNITTVYMQYFAPHKCALPTSVQRVHAQLLIIYVFSIHKSEIGQLLLVAWTTRISQF
jgi:hypothetical protein